MLPNKFTACLLCNSTQITPLESFSKDYLVKCKQCSFVFASKIPSTDELIAHYGTYPRSNTISAITIKRYNELLDKLEVFRKTNNLLDVGCGDGFFLETAKKRNWNVYGTEYTDVAIKLCLAKGIQMQQGKLDVNQYSPGFFDVISSFEVIEHINNPQEEISNFSTLLRSGGAVYVTTPNFNSLSRYYLKEKWNVIEYPEHLSYYTQKTLSDLFKKNNFSVHSFQSTGVSLSRIAAGSNSEAPPVAVSEISKDEALRTKTETQLVFKIAKHLVNWLLTLFSVGDSLKGTFVKR
jgi:2-polyprenyl-3-methyl-5-hydroxy-6-metoxy-1,4-benzoquinol methylase